MAKYREKNSEFDVAVLAFKRKYLLKLLQKTKHNILEVSRRTELSRNTIYKIIGLTKRELRSQK